MMKRIIYLSIYILLGIPSLFVAVSTFLYITYINYQALSEGIFSDLDLFLLCIADAGQKWILFVKCRCFGFSKYPWEYTLT